MKQKKWVRRAVRAAVVVVLGVLLARHLFAAGPLYGEKSLEKHALERAEELGITSGKIRVRVIRKEMHTFVISDHEKFCVISFRKRRNSWLWNMDAESAARTYTYGDRIESEMVTYADGLWKGKFQTPNWVYYYDIEIAEDLQQMDLTRHGHVAYLELKGGRGLIVFLGIIGLMILLRIRERWLEKAQADGQ